MGDDAGEAAGEARARIIGAAIALLTEGGREALTTRAVSAAAGVQAPAIYRLFGDKQGLVDAVAAEGFQAYLRQKRPETAGEDPVEGLRAGWDLHVAFGLANPAMFKAMYGEPRPDSAAPGPVRAATMLLERMRGLALAGRLRVDERRAADMVRAAAMGVVFLLLELPVEARDLGLSAAVREAVIAAVVTDAPALVNPGIVPVAAMLRAMLPEVAGLSGGERNLLEEWLGRMVSAAG